MKRVIVAGAGGYVGRKFAAALEGIAEVIGVDVLDGYIHPERLGALEGRYDVFYNLAWKGKGGALRADYNVQMANVKSALDFYKEAVRLGCKRYICAGTIGELMVELPECSKIRSQNFVYISAKNFLHRVLNAIEEPDKCRVIWVRLGNLYGGGDSGGNLVDYTLRHVMSNKDATFGPAEQPYDFVHVNDCVRALALIGVSESELEGDFYLGSGDVRPLKEYLWEIGRISKREALIKIGGRPDDGTRYREEWFSIDKLNHATGYIPRISFADGVGEMIREMSNEI